MRRVGHRLATLGVVVLIALHVVGPRSDDPTPRALALPAELWFRLAWMAAAWLVLLQLTRRVRHDETR